MPEQPTNNRRIVAVYGSASAMPGEPDWQVAYEVGRALATSGYCVLSGGYGGVMEACSQGAAEVGGHVMGAEVGLFRERGQRLNQWVTEPVPFETLRDRLYFFTVTGCVRGAAWRRQDAQRNVAAVEPAASRRDPAAVRAGQAMWLRFIGSATSTVSADDLRWLTLVERADQVVPALEAWWKRRQMCRAPGRPPHLTPGRTIRRYSDFAICGTIEDTRRITGRC